MTWNLRFISEKDFTGHVEATIKKYGEKLEPFDIKRFNKNIIDPMCIALPETIRKVVDNSDDVKTPKDTVIDELREIADQMGEESEDLAMAIAVYMLGFGSYSGFSHFSK